MIKRTLCLILSAITFLSVAACPVVSAEEIEETTVQSVSDTENGAEDTVDETMILLASLVRKYPEGKYWNHMGSSKNSPDTVTNTPCASHRGCSWTEGACSCNSFDRAIQCMGYAHKIAYDITGKSPRTEFRKSTRLTL